MFLPERGAAVDQRDGPGNVSVLVVSQHAALHALVKHLHFTLETEKKTETSVRILRKPQRNGRVSRSPEEEVGQPVEAALGHSGAQTLVDGGRTLEIHLKPLRPNTRVINQFILLESTEYRNDTSIYTY